MELKWVVTCGLGLEDFVAEELRALDIEPASIGKGAVSFTAGWRAGYLANWRLRTANRVLIELGQWTASNGDDLHAGARNLVRRKSRSGIDIGRLLNPSRTLVVRATTSHSKVTDTRWIALRIKDGLVDGQRNLHGRRSSVDRDDPDIALRVRLYKNEVTLLLDTSGSSLDHRGYRVQTAKAPVREHLAAACVLASGWDGVGPVVDPMCGSGTLLIEAASWALGWSPAKLRQSFLFERLPSFDAALWQEVRDEPLPAPASGLKLYGVDDARQALDAAAENLTAAGLDDLAFLKRANAFEWQPPEEPGLVIVNPAYGERIAGDVDQWQRLGDLLKQRYRGWKAVVLAGDESRGKSIGLRPTRRIPVFNGPIEARILTFDLY